MGVEEFLSGVSEYAGLALARYALVLPVAILFVATILDLLVERSRGKNRRLKALIISSVALFLALIILVFAPTENFDHTSQIIVFDDFAKFFSVFSIFVTIIILFISHYYLSELPELPVYYGLITGTAIGLILLPASVDIILLLVSWELLSIPLYIIVAYSFRFWRSLEGALKYYIMGSISSAILCVSLGILIVLTGSSNMYVVAMELSKDPNSTKTMLTIISMLTFFGGFGVKITLFPFHQWAPDTYQGSAPPITAYLAGTIKAVRFSAFIRISMIFLYMPEVQYYLRYIVAILAALTMTYGNIVALRQERVYRMLAYSSIAQMGYIMVGLVPGTKLGYASSIFYVFSFALGEVMVFLVIAITLHSMNLRTLEDYSGLGKEMPGLATLFTIGLFSLAGLPPLMGFVGKLYLFFAALDGGVLWLGILLAINSAISLGYYGWIAKKMFFDLPSKKVRRVEIHNIYRFSFWLIAVGLIIFGIYPAIIEAPSNLAALNVL